MMAKDDLHLRCLSTPYERVKDGKRTEDWVPIF